SFREVTGSDRDHEALLEFGRVLEGAMRRLFATFTERLPTRDAARALMGRDAWRDLVERPLADTLVERFDHPLVRGAIATDGLIGCRRSARASIRGSASPGHCASTRTRTSWRRPTPRQSRASCPSGPRPSCIATR